MKLEPQTNPTIPGAGLDHHLPGLILIRRVLGPGAQLPHRARLTIARSTCLLAPHPVTRTDGGLQSVVSWKGFQNNPRRPRNLYLGTPIPGVPHNRHHPDRHPHNHPLSPLNPNRFYLWEESAPLISNPRRSIHRRRNRLFIHKHGRPCPRYNSLKHSGTQFRRHHHLRRPCLLPN